MADASTPIRAKGFLNYLKEYWFLLAFIVSVAVAGWQSFQAVEAQASTNAGAISDLEEDVERDILAIRNTLTNKPSTFLVERDHSEFNNKFIEMAQAVTENENDIDDIETKFNELRIQDQRIESKIELETEKLKRAIEESSREQTGVLNQILREIQE